MQHTLAGDLLPSSRARAGVRPADTWGTRFREVLIPGVLQLPHAPPLEREHLLKSYTPDLLTRVLALNIISTS